MRFKFIGSNGSCGFETGKIYELNTRFRYNRKRWLFVWDCENSRRCCAYDTLEGFLDNWEVIRRPQFGTPKQSKDPWLVDRSGHPFIDC